MSNAPPVVVAGKVRAFQEYVTKNGATRAEVAVALKSSEETVRKVADLKASPDEVAEIASGLERVAALARQEIERETGGRVAEKSSGVSNRDALGKARTKPYGSSPRDIAARRGEDSGRSEIRRDGAGRSQMKLYS